MTTRPYVLLSVATSIDGHLDDTGPDRLLLSGPEDFDRVDEVRAGVDAILVGASTVRRDDPRLTVASAQRRAGRVGRGLPEHPLKVTVTRSGDLDGDLGFWRHGGAKLVFAVGAAAPTLRNRLAGLAEVVALGPVLDWGAVLDELGRRGVRRLLVEGGGSVHTQLMAQDLADELQLAIAPLIVGEAGAPAFLGPARYPGGARSRIRLLESRTVGDVVLLRYAPKDRAAEPRPGGGPEPETPAGSR